MSSTGKPFGIFRDDARWNDDRMAVEFTLDLRDAERDRAIVCRVSREALDDAARRSGPLDREEALQLFERFKSEIKSAVDRKLKLALFDPDGSITVSTVDLNN